MNKNFQNSVCKSLNKEFLRRTLNKFFIEKGYDNFKRSPYPPNIRDLSSLDPLSGLVEVSHSIDDINLINNSVKLIWNIFVQGNKRIFLGYTEHVNMTDISNNNTSKDEHYNGATSIENIIDHIITMISETDAIMTIHSRSNGQSAFNNLASKGAMNPMPMPFKRMNP